MTGLSDELRQDFNIRKVGTNFDNQIVLNPKIMYFHLFSVLTWQ